MAGPAVRVSVVRLGLMAGAGVVAAYAVWCLASPAAPGRGPAGVGMILASSALAGVAALRGARAAQGGRGSRAWRILATGWLLSAIGSAIHWGSWLIGGTPPATPSAADLLHLAGSISFLWAMASYPVSPPERFGRVRELLDVAILTVAVLAISWLALLRPVLQGLRADPIRLFWAGLWPALDAVFLALALRVILLADRPSELRPLLLLGVGGLAVWAGDLLGGFQNLFDGYVPGQLLDVTWAAGGLAAAWAGVEVTPAGLRAKGSAAGGGRRRLEALLPIAFAYVVVGFTILDASMGGSIDPAGLALSIALSVLLVARQGVVAGQNDMRQYASLLNASGDMAFICDRNGGLRLFNPAFVAALGLEGMGPRRLSLGEFVPSSASLPLLLTQAGGEGWTGEVFLKRRDGTEFPAMLSLRPVEGMPGPGGLVAGTAADLTGVRARETELRSALHDVASARAELESLNRDLERKVEARTQQLANMVDDLDRLNKELKELDKMKSEFVALVSHELRAPLTNIRSGLELMLASHPGLDDRVRESLSLVEEEAARLGRFVEAILDLSALEAGKFPLRLAPVSPWKTARLAVDRFRGHPAYPRIVVTFDPDAPDVIADERALGSVFFHLLDNAAKYGGGGAISVGARTSDDRVEIVVEDRGPGIPEAERDRVFEMFHRLDARDDREVYGHGLGLHLVRRMLDAMGGRIRIESAQAGGTSMVVSLPRVDAKASPDAQGPSTSRSVQPKADV